MLGVLRATLPHRFSSTTTIMSAPGKTLARPTPVAGRSFKLALVQLGETSPDKKANLARAREMVLKAAKGESGNGDVDMVVLPECFNSLYGTGEV